MTINVVSEVANLKNIWGGMYTAYINHVLLLKQLKLSYFINGSPDKADITHIHSYGPIALIKMKRAKKAVVSAHALPDTMIGSFKGSQYWIGLIKAYLRYFYNQADIILVLNPHSKKVLEDLGVRAKMVLLSNSLDTGIFRKELKLRTLGRKQLMIPDDKFVIMGAGHIIPRKGIDDFILTAKALPEFTFIWVGGKILKFINAETEVMKELLKNKPRNIIFTGEVKYDQMPMYYNAADVFLFPTRQDIAPMAVVEAAACGLPLILRDLAEFKDLFDDHYIAAKTLEDFISNVKKLHGDKKFYESMTKKSRKLALDFSAEYIGKKLLRVYSDLMK